MGVKIRPPPKPTPLKKNFMFNQRQLHGAANFFAISKDLVHIRKAIRISREKGNRPIHNKDHTKDVQNLIEDGVWNELKHPCAFDYLLDLSKAYDIKYETLKSYHYKLMKNPDWIPKHSSNYPPRVFTQDEEVLMVDLIYQIAQSEKVEIKNELIQNVLMAFYNELPEERKQNHVNKETEFSASSKYVRKFRIRNHFLQRKLHSKRRPAAKTRDIENFIRKVGSLVKSKVPKSHKLNVYETFWRCIQTGLYTWAPIGSNNVTLETNGTEKDGFTAVATVDAEGIGCCKLEVNFFEY